MRFALTWKLIDEIHSINPQISQRQIFSSLIGPVVGIVVLKPQTTKTEESLLEMARDNIGKLLYYSSLRDIDVPIVNLSVDNHSIRFGKVSFETITETDYESDWWKENIKPNYAGNLDREVLSIGRASSPGDWEIALDYAENAVRETLLILRGISFPFEVQEVNQFGIFNEFLVRSNKPYRLHKPEETVSIDRKSTVITRLGPPIRIYKLYQDLLLQVDDSIRTTLNDLLIQDSRTRMQEKLISGIRWLGEATKPDALTGRYMKVAIALESLIGGEPNDNYLTTRGITATLAERAAFLVTKDFGQRRLIDREMKKYYSLRSKIVHGDLNPIEPNDFLRFGSLVRKVAFELCMTISEFSTVDDLQEWVFQQRYA